MTESTTAQVATSVRGFAFSQSHGYQWWVTTEKGHHAYAAVGFGADLVEVVEVVPDLRLVAVTATEPGENTLPLELLRFMVADAIVPAVGG